MRQVALASALVLLLVTTGCLGSVSPAEIPEQDVSERDWKKTDESASSIAMGLGERVTKEYNPQQNANSAGVTVVSANDVPMVDESQFIPWALDRVEKRYDIELQETGTRSIELANMDASVTATNYDVQGAPADAKASIFTPPCEDFVVVVAWGTTESGDGGILTNDSGQNGYQQSIDVARHVVCR